MEFSGLVRESSPRENNESAVISRLFSRRRLRVGWNHCENIIQHAEKFGRVMKKDKAASSWYVAECGPMFAETMFSLEVAPGAIYR